MLNMYVGNNADENIVVGPLKPSEVLYSEMYFTRRSGHWLYCKFLIEQTSTLYHVIATHSCRRYPVLYILLVSNVLKWWALYANQAHQLYFEAKHFWKLLNQLLS